MNTRRNKRVHFADTAAGSTDAGSKRKQTSDDTNDYHPGEGTSADLDDVNSALDEYITASEADKIRHSEERSSYKVISPTTRPNAAAIVHVLIGPAPTTLVGRRDALVTLGFSPRSTRITLDEQLQLAAEPCERPTPEEGGPSASEPAVVLRLVREQWQRKETRVDWLAALLFRLEQRFSCRTRAEEHPPQMERLWRARDAAHAARRGKGFSAEYDNSVRSEAAHAELTDCHDELTENNGLNGGARPRPRDAPSPPRLPPRSRKDVLSGHFLWAHQRQLLEQHEMRGALKTGVDVLAVLDALPGAALSEADVKMQEATKLEAEADAARAEAKAEPACASSREEAGAALEDGKMELDLDAALEETKAEADTALEEQDVKAELCPRETALRLRAARLREEAEKLKNIPSVLSTESLASSFAIGLDAPILALHGNDATKKPMVAGCTLADVVLAGCEPEQMQEDAMALANTVKATLDRDSKGRLIPDEKVGYGYQGTATLGKAKLKYQCTAVVTSTNSLDAQDHDADREDSVLEAMEDIGPALAALVRALRKVRHYRKLSAKLLFYLAEGDKELSRGTWHARAVEERPCLASALRHQDDEKPGVVLRLTIALTKGGGLQVAPSSMGHDATTLKRDVLQAHLLAYDFYTKGRTPFSHRGSPRKGDGVALALTFRDCTVAQAVAILKVMGMSLTVAA